MVSLANITTNGKALFLAYDQGLEHGPTDFNDDSIDPNFVLNIAQHGHYNAVILQKGVAEKYYKKSLGVPLILKLNGKTNLTEGEPMSPLICTVEEAVKLGAVAVGYTVYVGSERQDEMFEDFGAVVEEAHKKRIPVIGWMYPRGKAIKAETPDITAYAARVGLEMGADMVKVKYHPEILALRHIVESAGKAKVVFSGGKHVPQDQLMTMVRHVKASGAAGMAIGRNVWQSKNPLQVTRGIKKILLE